MTEILLLITTVLLVLLLSRKWVLQAFGAKVSYQMWCLVPLCLLITQLPLHALLAYESVPVVSDIQRFVVKNIANKQFIQAELSAILIALWAFGIGIVSFLFGRIHVNHFNELAQHLKPVSTNQKSAIENLIREESRLSVLPKIYTSTSIKSPMICGFLRTKLILPQGFFTQYTATQQRLILAHEIHHYGRFDIYWNYFAMLLLMVFWFHPLAWYAYARFRQDQELSCDQAVLVNKPEKEKQLYARALVETLEHQHLHVAYLSFGKFGDNKMMFERINQIKNGKMTSKFVAPVILLSASLLITASIHAADIPPPPPPQDANATPMKIVKHSDEARTTNIPPPPKPVQPAKPTMKSAPPVPPVPKAPNAEALKALTPIVRVAPAYPEKAASDSVEGWVVLNFDIDPNGTPRNIKVIDAAPKGTFDESARKALSKWRYSPHNIGDANATIQMDFLLDSD